MEKIENFIKKLLPVLLIAVILTSYFSFNIVAYYVNSASGSDTAYPATFSFNVTITADTESQVSTIEDSRNEILADYYTNVYIVNIINTGETTGEAKLNSLTLSKPVPEGVTFKSVSDVELSTQGATSISFEGVDVFTKIAPGAEKQVKFKIVSKTDTIKFNYSPNITANVSAQQVN